MTSLVMSDELDLDEYVKNKRLDVYELLIEKADITIKKPEDPVVRDARIFNERALLLFGIAIVCFTLYFCISTIQSPISSPDDKKWAQSMLTLVLGSVMGYVTRANTSRP